MNPSKSMVANASSPGIAFGARRHLAILVADVSGYARLMESWEHETHARMMKHSALTINPSVVAYRGAIVKNTGDGFIATFDSALDSVECAAVIQDEIARAESAFEPARRIHFRIGLHSGLVIEEAHDVFGNHVNIAARLQSHAMPGGIIASDALIAELGPRNPLTSESLGELKLKNIVAPISAFALRDLRHGAIDYEGLPSDKTRPARRPAIAILPFLEPNSGSRETYFGAGFADSIADALAGLQDIQVVSAASTLKYRKVGVDLQDVSRDLGVTYVLSGRIQRGQEKYRISVELSDATSSGILWAKTFQSLTLDIFELQDQIALDVMERVVIHIHRTELVRARAKRPENMDAYDHFLRGVDLLRGRSADDFAHARTLLTRALDEDDTYVPAYSYAAFWHIRNVAQGWSSNGVDDVQAADRLSARAVELDPLYSLGLAVHAHCRSYLSKDHDGARAYLDSALELSPNSSMALVFSSANHSYRGSSDKAVADAQLSIRLSPSNPFSFFFHATLCMAHVCGENFQEAVVWGYRAMRENPRFSANLRLLAVSLVALGREEEARRVASALLEVDPKFRVDKFRGQLPFADTTRREEFLRNLSLAGLPL